MGEMSDQQFRALVNKGASKVAEEYCCRDLSASTFTYGKPFTRPKDEMRSMRAAEWAEFLRRNKGRWRAAEWAEFLRRNKGRWRADEGAGMSADTDCSDVYAGFYDTVYNTPKREECGSCRHFSRSEKLGPARETGGNCQVSPPTEDKPDGPWVSDGRVACRFFGSVG